MVTIQDLIYENDVHGCFLLYNLIPEYLNDFYGSDPKKMLDVFKIYNTVINANYPSFSKNIEKITRCEMHEIMINWHSMKVVVVDENGQTYLVFINTGLGLELNNNKFYTRKIDRNNLRDTYYNVILSGNSMSSIEEFFTMFNDRTQELDEIIDRNRIEISKMCNKMYDMQISGSCTFYSTLYAYLYTLYDRNFVAANTYREYLKNLSFKTINNINIGASIRKPFNKYAYDFLKALPVLSNKYSDKIVLSDVDKRDLEMIRYNEYTDGKIIAVSSQTTQSEKWIKFEEKLEILSDDETVDMIEFLEYIEYMSNRPLLIKMTTIDIYPLLLKFYNRLKLENIDKIDFNYIFYLMESMFRSVDIKINSILFLIIYGMIEKIKGNCSIIVNNSIPILGTSTTLSPRQLDEKDMYPLLCYPKCSMYIEASRLIKKLWEYMDLRNTNLLAINGKPVYHFGFIINVFFLRNITVSPASFLKYSMGNDRDAVVVKNFYVGKKNQLFFVGQICSFTGPEMYEYKDYIQKSSSVYQNDTKTNSVLYSYKSYFFQGKDTIKYGRPYGNILEIILKVHYNYYNPLHLQNPILDAEIVEKMVSLFNVLLPPNASFTINSMTNHVSSFYNTDTDNFYYHSRELFIRELKEPIDYLDNVYDYRILLLYLYCLFYEIDSSYNDNTRWIYQSGKVMCKSMIPLLTSSKVIDEKDYQNFLEMVKLNQYIPSFATMLCYEYVIKDNIFKHKHGKLIREKLKGVIFKDNVYEYEYKNVVYRTNTVLQYEFFNSLASDPMHLEKKYVVFKRDRDNHVLFSDMFPPLIRKMNGKICLLENNDYEIVIIKENEKIYDIIVNDSSLTMMFKNIHNDYMIYKEIYHLLTHDNPCYEKISSYAENLDEKIIRDRDVLYNGNLFDKVCYSNYFPIINLNYIFYNGIKATVTKETLYIIVNKKFLRDPMDFNRGMLCNMYGLETPVYYGFDKFPDNINIFYMDYPIKTSFVGDCLHITDVDFDNATSGMLLLITLSLSHCNNLLIKCMNKFISLIDCTSAVLFNHPFTHIFMYLMRMIYNDNDNLRSIFNQKKFDMVIKQINFPYNNWHNIDKYLLLDNFKNFSSNFGLSDIYKLDDNNFEKLFKKALGDTFSYRYGQDRCINEIINGKKRYVLYDLMMGFGKSSVIIPYIAFRLLFSTEYDQIVIVTPEHLVNEMHKTLVSIAAHMPICIIKKIDNVKFVNEFREIIKGIIIISDITIKHALVTKSDLLLDIQKFGKTTRRFMLIDEVDDCLDPIKSNFNLRIKTSAVKDVIENNFMFTRFMLYLITRIEIDKGVPIEKIIEKCIINAFDNKDKFIQCILEIRNCPPGITYNEAVYLYTIRRLIVCVTIFNQYIINRHYGFGHDKNKESYFYAIPYKAINTPAENSEFNDIFLTMMLTVNLYMKMENLRERDVERVMDHIIGDEHRIRKNILPVHRKKLVSLVCIIKECTIIEDVQKKINSVVQLSKHNDVYIMLFTLHIDCVLQNIKFCTNFKNTSFMEILNLADNYIGFTGTSENLCKIINNKSEEIPQIGGNDIFSINTTYSTKDKDYEKVVQFYQNVEKLNKPVETQDVFDMIQKNKKINCLIDTGCILREKIPREYVNAIFDKIKRVDIVIYFDQNDKPKKIDRTMRTEKDFDSKNELEIEELKEKTYFVFYDNKHVRGTDLLLPKNTHGLVTISKFNYVSDIMQGIFRLRSLGEGQTCEFIVDGNLLSSGQSLLQFLKANSDFYQQNQQSELLLQTIYANKKFKDDDYDNFETEIKLFPFLNEGKIDMNNVFSNNYVLTQKLGNLCFSTGDNLTKYCNLIKKYLNVLTKHSLDISTSVSFQVTTEQLRALNINQNIEVYNEHISYYEYDRKIPYFTILPNLDIYQMPFSYTKCNYLYAYVYMHLQHGRMTSDILHDELKKLLLNAKQSSNHESSY